MIYIVYPNAKIIILQLGVNEKFHLSLLIKIILHVFSFESFAHIAIIWLYFPISFYRI